MPRKRELEDGWVTTQHAADLSGLSRQGAINAALKGQIRGVLVGRKWADAYRPVWVFEKRSCEEFAREHGKGRGGG